MTCDEFSARLDAYTSGALSDQESEVLEAHAAECQTCGALLERSTASTLPVFVATLPPELRASVLQAVSARQKRARITRRGRAAAVMGVAALLAIMFRPGNKQAQLVIADSSAVHAPVSSGDVSAAGDRARSEFIALDEAARELASALSRAPDDKQLTEFMHSVAARRSELEQRVKDAL